MAVQAQLPQAALQLRVPVTRALGARGPLGGVSRKPFTPAASTCMTSWVLGTSPSSLLDTRCCGCTRNSHLVTLRRLLGQQRPPHEEERKFSQKPGDLEPRAGPGYLLPRGLIVLHS